MHKKIEFSISTATTVAITIPLIYSAGVYSTGVYSAEADFTGDGFAGDGSLGVVSSVDYPLNEDISLEDQRLFFSPEQREELELKYSLEQSERRRTVDDEARQTTPISLPSKEISSQIPPLLFNGYALDESSLILWINNLPWSVLKNDSTMKSEETVSATRNIWFNQELHSVRLPPGRTLSHTFTNAVTRVEWESQERQLLVILSDRSVHRLVPGSAAKLKDSPQ